MPISLDAEGRATLAARNATTAVLRSVIGGSQGCGGASLLCISGYHEALSDVQRLYLDTDFACDADDTYLCDELLPPADEPGRPTLYDAYDAKRTICFGRCQLTSKLLKVALSSAAGDLSTAPADLPGSPNHPTASAPIRVFKIAGTFVGDADACSDAARTLIAARLRPLERIVGMFDSGEITNVAQLQTNLTRLVASAIFNHWCRTMLPPEQTEAAAEYSDDAVEIALSAILRTDDSPPERAALALLCSRLPTRDGGLGTSNYAPTRTHRFAASFLHAWPICCRVCPGLAGTPTTPRNLPTFAAFRTAYARLTDALADVRRRHAALDSDVRFWVDGTKHSAFHTFLSSAYCLPAFASLFDGTVNNTQSRCTQRKFAVIINCKLWLDANGACHAFDSSNAAAVLPHREATRHISTSQNGSGAFLTRLPDPTIRGSTVASAGFRTCCQRRLGLYVSVLKPALDLRASLRRHVTQHHYLGDAYINDASHTERHNAVLDCVHRALLAGTSGLGTIKLGDKGDGSEASKAATRERHTYLNDGHIPDLYRLGHPHCLWELKCYSPFASTRALGRGSRLCGGAASTSDGHLFAFGNTEESLRAKVLGLAARGDPTGPQLNRRTGEGYVAAHAGDYADAIKKGSHVKLLLVETTGAFSLGLDLMLRALGAGIKAFDTVDVGARA